MEVLAGVVGAFVVLGVMAACGYLLWKIVFKRALDEVTRANLLFYIKVLGGVFVLMTITALIIAIGQ